MRTGIVAFLSGNLGLLYSASLPVPDFLFFLFGLMLCFVGLLYKSCLKYTKYITKYCLPVKIFTFFLLGYLYTAFVIHVQTPTVDPHVRRIKRRGPALGYRPPGESPMMDRIRSIARSVWVPGQYTLRQPSQNVNRGAVCQT